MEKKAKYISLSDYCSSVRDGTHDTPKPTETGKYLVTSRAVNNNTIDFSSCYYISQKDFDKINKRSLVEQWDIIMTMIGSVGRLLLVKDSPDYAIKNMALFKIGDEMRAKWLYYYLSNKSVQDYFEQIANGTSQHFIGLGQLRKLKIADFTPDSVCIASILSSYDNLIELNTRRIKLLEQMAENLYKEWFVRFRFPNYQNTPIENGIPKGWRKGQLGEIVNFLNGFAFKSETFVDCAPYKVVTIKNVQDGKFDGINVDYIEEVPKRMPQYCNLLQGDILLSLTGNVGRVCIVLGSNYLLNQRVAKLTSDHPHFTYCLFRTDTIFNTLNSIAYGTAQLNLSPIKAARLKMLIPPVELRNLFDKQVASLFTEIATLQTQSANLTRQRDLLLPRLMSGQLPTQ